MIKIIKFLSLAALSIFMTNKAFATSPITLEHTFDGYYYPYNFPMYLVSDEDRYFYSPIINPDEGRINLKTYNEDYSLRDNYNVTYNIPDGYKGTSIAFSPSYQLTDGTPFFIVSFTSTSIGIGHSGYAIANMYNANTGKLITELGTATSNVSSIGTVYVINGKPSIVMVYYDYNLETYVTNYTTKVYSLGTPQSKIIEVENSVNNSTPVFIYDMSGRLLNNPVSGHPYIEVMNDGKAKITINN